MDAGLESGSSVAIDIVTATCIEYSNVSSSGLTHQAAGLFVVTRRFMMRSVSVPFHLRVSFERSATHRTRMLAGLHAGQRFFLG